tara:strand:+ start:739 stop:960 length:222 start_codon:yes stop_codon:yes gene_type:complete
MNKGDLTWIPSGTTLLKFRDDDTNMVIRYVVTPEPSNSLVLKEADSHFLVLYNGEEWYACKADIYKSIKSEDS